MQVLDEIQAGVFDGWTYAQIEKDRPEEFAARKADKLRYRRAPLIPSCTARRCTPPCPPSLGPMAAAEPLWSMEDCPEASMAHKADRLRCIRAACSVHGQR